MPLKLVPPRKGKSSNWSIRGSYLKVPVDRSAGTPKKSVAQKELDKLIDAIERGEYPPKPEQPSAPTFLSAAVAYMKAGRSRRYLKPLIEHFGEKPLGEIDQDAIDAAAVSLYPNVSPGTRNGSVYTPVAAVLHHANIVITVRRPKGAKGNARSRFLSPEDAFAILDAAESVDPEMARLLTFLLYTGCRIGEAMAMRWENVNLAESTASVINSKNGNPREMKLRPEIVEALTPHKQIEGKVFRFKQGGHRNFLFLNAKVTACGLPAVKRPARGKKQIVPVYRFGWVTFHTFRHTWATWMRRYGGADLQGLVGTGQWDDQRSVARYAHTHAHEEWDRIERLPSRGKSVDLPVKKKKSK